MCAKTNEKSGMTSKEVKQANKTLSTKDFAKKYSSYIGTSTNRISSASGDKTTSTSSNGGIMSTSEFAKKYSQYRPTNATTNYTKTTGTNSKQTVTNSRQLKTSASNTTPTNFLERFEQNYKTAQEVNNKGVDTGKRMGKGVRGAIQGEIGGVAGFTAKTALNNSGLSAEEMIDYNTEMPKDRFEQADEIRKQQTIDNTKAINEKQWKKRLTVANEFINKSNTTVEDAKENADAIQKFLVDVAKTGTEIAIDSAIGGVASIVNPTLGQYASSASMYVRASGTAYVDALNKGATESEAQTYGTMVGVVEILTERLSGGLGKVYGKGLGEKLSTRVVANVMKKLGSKPSTIKAVVRLGQVIGEGNEEVVSDALNPILRSLTYGGTLKEEYAEEQLSDWLYDWLLGSFMGGLGSVVGANTNLNAEVDNFYNNNQNIAKALSQMETQDAPSNSVVKAIMQDKSALEELGIDTQNKHASEIKHDIRVAIDELYFNSKDNVGTETNTETNVETNVDTNQVDTNRVNNVDTNVNNIQQDVGLNDDLSNDTVQQANDITEVENANVGNVENTETDVAEQTEPRIKTDEETKAEKVATIAKTYGDEVAKLFNEEDADVDAITSVDGQKIMRNGYEGRKFYPLKNIGISIKEQYRIYQAGIEFRKGKVEERVQQSLRIENRLVREKQITYRQLRAIKSFEKITNHKIIFEDMQRSTVGYTDAFGNIHLNSNIPATECYTQIIGHELYHLIFNSNKELGESFSKTLQTMLDDNVSKKLQNRLVAMGYASTQVTEEMSADAFGVVFSEAEILESFAYTNMPLFKRISAKVLDFIKDFNTKVNKLSNVYKQDYIEYINKLDEMGALINDIIEIDSEREVGVIENEDGTVEQKFKKIEDNDLINALEKEIADGEYTVTYKAYLKIDDKYYSPMASKTTDENGKTVLRGGQRLGEWWQSEGKLTEEQIAKFKRKSPKAWQKKYAKEIANGESAGWYGDYALKKSDSSGKSIGTVNAAYNPYQHSSNWVLNDQFEGASDRPDLAVVECIIPNSELTNRYWAKYAKDPTGVHDWKSGPIAGQIKNSSRKVYMTRYIKAVRELSDNEVARKIKEVLDKENKQPKMYFNNLHPRVKEELEKMGVEIDYNGSPMYQSRSTENDDSTKYKKVSAQKEAVEVPNDVIVNVGNMVKTTQKYGHEKEINAFIGYLKALQKDKALAEKTVVNLKKRVGEETFNKIMQEYFNMPNETLAEVNKEVTNKKIKVQEEKIKKQAEEINKVNEQLQILSQAMGEENTAYAEMYIKYKELEKDIETKIKNNSRLVKENKSLKSAVKAKELKASSEKLGDAITKLRKTMSDNVLFNQNKEVTLDLMSEVLMNIQAQINGISSFKFDNNHLDIDKIETLINNLTAQGYVFQNEEIKRLFENVNKMNANDVAELTPKHIYEMAELVNSVAKQVSSRNKIIDGKGNLLDADLVADVIVSDYDNVYVAKTSLKSMRFENLVSFITGYKKGNYLAKVLRDVQLSEWKQIKLVNDMNKFMGKFNQKKFKEHLQEEVEYEGVKMNRDLLISIYMHTFNEDNILHITNGGIYVPTTKDYYNPNKKNDAWNNKKALVIDGDIEKVQEDIESLLTKEDMEYVMMLKACISTMQKSVNRVSRLIQNADAWNINEYWAINVDKDIVGEGQEKLGSTISSVNTFGNRNHNSKKPILLHGTQDHISSLINIYSRYVGSGVEMHNLFTLLGLNIETEEFEETSITKTIRNKFGNDAIDQLTRNIADFEGKKRNTDANMFGTIRSLAYSKALVLNAGVASKQAVSFISACSEIGYRDVFNKHLVNHSFLEGNSINKLINKYTGLLDYRTKGMGDFENDVSGIVKTPLMKINVNEKINESKYLNLITLVDYKTVQQLWYACENYVYRTTKLRPTSKAMSGTDAFYIRVAEVYNNVVTRTQPNYSTLERAEFIKSKDPVFMLTSMYKTQPAQNYNQAQYAINNYKAQLQYAKGEDGKVNKNDANLKDAKNYCARTLATLTAQSIMYTLLDTAINALRTNASSDDDDDKDYFYFAKMAFTVANSIIGGNAYGNIILVLSKAMLGIIDYTDEVGVNLFDPIDNMATKINKLTKSLIKGENEVENWQAVSRMFTDVFGYLLPTGEAKRIYKALEKYVEPFKESEFNKKVAPWIVHS